MTPRKLKIAIATFPYGGNGAISSEFPHVGNWRARTMMKIMKDERCEDDIAHIELCDTPITMTRNRAVLQARKVNADVLLMIDSDMWPDHGLYTGDAYAKPFWNSSFDYLYNHWERGPVVIGAPYCGSSPVNNIFVFRWGSDRNPENCQQDMAIKAYGREEAAIKVGIESVAALPTGLIMFDMRMFKLTEPPDIEAGKYARGWFYYDWKDKYASEKVSTEDVTTTRDMSLMGMLKLGYNPILCNWDAWAGHVKQEVVPKPYPITLEQIESRYRAAAKNEISDTERMVDVGEGGVDPLLDKAPISLQNLTKQIAAAPPGLTSWGDVKAETMSKEVLDGWMERLKLSHPDDDDVLTGITASLAKDGKKIEVIEIGSFLGNSAELIIKACNGRCRLYCVDTWLGDNDEVMIEGKLRKTTSHVSTMCNSVYGPNGLRQAFEERMRPYLAGHISMIQKTSVEAAKDWPAGKLVDMVYIDADHSYEGCKADIEAWFSKVRPGGIICGHDYGGTEVDFPGVKQAVDELIPDRHVEAAVWWYRVPDTNRISHHYKTNGKHKASKPKKPLIQTRSTGKTLKGVR